MWGIEGNFEKAPEQGRVGGGFALEELRELVQKTVDDDGRPPGLGLERGGLDPRFPVFWGSASDRASKGLRARNRATKRCSLPGVSSIATPSCFGSPLLSLAQSRSLSASGCGRPGGRRPARL